MLTKYIFLTTRVTQILHYKTRSNRVTGIMNLFKLVDTDQDDEGLIFRPFNVPRVGDSVRSAAMAACELYRVVSKNSLAT